MKIEITQDCIKRGKRGKGSECPTALAMIDTGLLEVSVGTFRAYYDTKDGCVSHLRKEKRLPKKIQNFIKRFDNGKPVKPISFLLTI